jgi:hypothetical protein
VRALDRAGSGLPALPQVALAMHRAQAELLREAVRGT